MPGRVVFQSLSLTSVVALVVGLLFASAAFAQGPPPELQLWSAVSTLDALSAARTCAADPVCTSYDPPEGLQVDPATGQPLLSVHAKGAMDVGPLLDWAAAHPEVVLVEKLVHVFDMTGFEVDVSMDLLDAEAWTSLRDALELMASTAYVSLHGIPVQVEGIHPDLAAAHGAIQACGGDPVCLQDLHELWPWLDAELAIGALQIEVPHNGAPGQHDAIAAELESLTWAEPPWIFAIEPVAGGEHVTRAVGRMPSAQLDGLTAWLAGQPWSARSRPMVEDELSEVRLQLETADAAADVFACDGDVGCHYDVSTLHQAVVSPGGRLGVLLHGEDPDIEGLNGLEYPGWSMAPAGYVHDGEAGLLEHQALRELGLGRWNLGEALSVGLDRNPDLVGLSREDWSAAWASDDTPLTWQPGIPGPGEVLAIEPAGLEHSYGTIQEAINASGDGWHILVGRGYYDELIQVQNSSGLRIQGTASVSLRGAHLASCANTLLQDLSFNAVGTGQPGVLLSGSCTVSLLRCDVHGTDVGVGGIEVTSGATLTLQKSRLHDNWGPGLKLAISGVATHLIQDNVVDSNAGSGIVLEEGISAQLVGNNVFSNDGYGLESVDGSGQQPALVVLADNTIALNGGEAVPGQSSADLGRFGAVLDEWDEDNTTTHGDEGQGLRPLVDPDRVWRSLWDDGELAELFPGLSDDELQPVKDKRDALLASRLARVDVEPAPPFESMDCDSDFYQGVLQLDYLVDGSRPPATTGPPPLRYVDIHDALDSVEFNGDLSGDGEIRICVMPGVYPGGFVVDVGGTSAGTPPIELFAAAGPGVTHVQRYRDPAISLPGFLPLPPAISVVGPSHQDAEVTIRGFNVSGYHYWAPEPDFVPHPPVDPRPLGTGALRAHRGEHGTLELTLQQMLFHTNSSRTSGGAVRAHGVDLVVRDSYFFDNRAEFGGGAIFAFAMDEPDSTATTDGSLVVEYSEFLLNEATDLMGTADCLESPENCIIWGKSDCYPLGGGVECDYDGLTGDHTDEWPPSQPFSLDVRGGAVASWTLDEVSLHDVHLWHNGTVLTDNGKGGGFSATDTAQVSASLTIFESNSSYSAGGLSIARGPLDVTESMFLQNWAGRRGGALEVDDSNLAVSQSLFRHNRSEETTSNDAVSSYGGGAAFLSGDEPVARVFAHSEFGWNTANAEGGAVKIAATSPTQLAGPVTFEECFFQRNSAEGLGPAVGRGGAVYSRSQDLEMLGTTQSNFTYNLAEQGGALYVERGSAYVAGTLFDNNRAVKEVDWDDTGTDPDSTFFGAAGHPAYGGAIAVGGEGTGEPVVTITSGSSFTGNTAYAAPGESGNSGIGAGGAIQLGRGSLVVAEASFWENSAEDYGGAIALFRYDESEAESALHLQVGTDFSDNRTFDQDYSSGGAVSCGNLASTAFVAGPTMSVATQDHVTFVTNVVETAWTGSGPYPAGGALALRGTCTATIGTVFDEASPGVVLFRDNTAWAGGGLSAATYDPSQETTSIELQNSVFETNHAVSEGGGIYGEGNLLLSGESLLLEGNTARVWLWQSEIGGGLGGGMALHGDESLGYPESAALDLNNVMFAGNIAEHQGGGLYLNGWAGAELADVVFSENRATGETLEPLSVVGSGGGGYSTWMVEPFNHVGGGYYSNECTDSNDLPAGAGGGVQMVDGSGASFNQLEFMDNSAPVGSALSVESAEPEDVALENVIVAGNRGKFSVRILGQSPTADINEWPSLSLGHVTISGNRWPAHPEDVVGLLLWGSVAFQVDSSVISLNDGEVQVVLEEDPPFGAPDGTIEWVVGVNGVSRSFSHIYSDVSDSPIDVLAGTCSGCELLDPGHPDFTPMVDPTFEGDSSNPGMPPYSVIPIEDYDFHPGAGSPLLFMANPSLGTPLDIGAFGGPGGPTWTCSQGC